MLFTNIIGQNHVKTILNTLYQKKHFPPLLFVGPKGIGKRTVAINFAQIINCPDKNDINLNQCTRCKQIGNLINFDVKLIFPIPQRRARTITKIIADNEKEDDSSVISFVSITTREQNKEKEKIQSALAYIGENIHNYVISQTKPDLPATNYHAIEIIHWLKNEMSYKPVIGTNKVIIIVDADRMRHDAANALLKTLEEPQKDTLFILTTERLSNILPTIRSRCQTIWFSSLTKDIIINYLIQNKQISETDAKLAAEISEGSLRKALLFVDYKDLFLPNPELIKLIDRSRSSPLETLNEINKNEYEEISPQSIISSLLFIYRSALHEKLNLPVFFKSDIIQKITASLTKEQIIFRISFLLNALSDASYNLNKKLYLFSVLSTVRL